LVSILLVLPSFLVNAASNGSKDSAKQQGKISSKDEVVYATLTASGKQQEIYVVNNFEVEKAGTLTDYGTYSNLKNLTDLSEMEQQDQKVIFTAPEGKFYYQGNMEDQPLPWNISVSYLLDGKKINPDELAGKNGHIDIEIVTSQNAQADPIFFENYLLQVSLILDGSLFSNIESESGMIANVGKDKQVTFTVMPEKEGQLSLGADVAGFELAGIDIAGVPSTLSIDPPDMDEMTGEMTSLSDGIKDVNNGVDELNKGISQLNKGAAALLNGSAQYNSGISKLNASSSELVGASQSISQALNSMHAALGQNSDQNPLGGLKELQTGLTQIAGGLRDTSAGLNELRENYSAAYSALDQAIGAIPGHEISEGQIQQLYESGADEVVVNQLVETYAAASKAKGTYAAVKQAFDAVDPALKQISASVGEMANQLAAMSDGLGASLDSMGDANGLSQLQEGLAALSSNYKEFHGGLVSYTKGAGQLAGSYSELHSGINELSGGIGQLDDGAGQLLNGTNQLYEATHDLPDQMKAEIDKMIADFENADFEAVSFVSKQNNDKISNVQFVIKTQSISKDKQDTAEEQPQEKKGIWERFLDLFI
jgi:X-X-X-Leu-X-X-Gly heptad repeat protein